MRGSRHKSAERIIEKLLLASATIAVIIVFFIILYLFRDAYPAFKEVGLVKILTGMKWNPVGEPPSYGAYPLVVGTVLVTLGAMAFSIPLGIGSAIFISEIAPSRLKPGFKFLTELLSGIPSVVYGFFGLVVMTTWLRITFNQPTGESWLAGSILLGIMALPTIISVSEDAISSVPTDYKEASLAVGATKWQTIRNVVVPSALSGITAAIILGIGRAIGETMAVMMVTGNAAVLPEPITNVFSPIRTITGTLGIEMGEVAVGSSHYHALFALAVILFVIVLLVNSSALGVLMKLNEKFNPTEKKSRGWIPRAAASLLRRAFWGAIVVVILYFAYCRSGVRGSLEAGLVLAFFSVFVIILAHHPFPRHEQTAFFAAISGSAVVVLILLGVILYYIVSKGIPAISWEFLTQPPRDLGRGGGIFPAIVGTLYLIGGAMLIAVPPGVGAGIYLSEYAREGKITRLIRAGIDNLNGTPSIVFGLFGFAFLVLYLNFGISLLAGMITLGVMVLPTIVRTTEEAVKSVPQSLREASLAVGATKWQTIRNVVVPPAAPGVITGIILSVGRAAGETAPIMFTATVFSQRFLPHSPLDPVMALPYHLFVLTTSIPNSIQNAYGTALVLLVVVLLIYAAAAMIRFRYRRTVRW
ncbi:MAG: phosphate ABC transporter permease PstA [Theionarchaea archaeon]|nr:phosphate ABC transporter permease PstA [Theionarchaea archaeon]MBU7022149.1 phosphate ABC transporter permease PstA [Theionarchaea archaeon]MBU7035378.1 phosphate ABC transporter permease PstA [Theionarchaea archaeon]MBU7040182.1 phosphate ABC transporter permease PstA [Theionarchaea archaeon]